MLQAFLYILMRDEVPTGVVAKIIQELEKAPLSFNFTNDHLAQMAADYERRINAIRPS